MHEMSYSARGSTSYPTDRSASQRIEKTSLDQSGHLDASDEQLAVGEPQADQHPVGFRKPPFGRIGRDALKFQANLDSIDRRAQKGATRGWAPAWAGIYSGGTLNGSASNHGDSFPWRGGGGDGRFEITN